MHTRALVTSAFVTTSLVIAGLVGSQIGLAEPQDAPGATVGRGSVVAPTASAARVQAGTQGASTSTAPMALGVNASLGGRRALAPDAAWNIPIDHLSVDPQSDKLIASMGADAALHPDFGTVYRGLPAGIPYVVVSGDEKRYPVVFDYEAESDHVLYPIPPNPPIEGVAPGKLPSGDGDHHLLVIDRDNSRLYELYNVRFTDGKWHAGSGAVFDLFGDTKRPRGWTSADAAGLPVFPGLVRYDEAVERGLIDHALRFTVAKTRSAFTAPATHAASKDDNPALPPMGLRVRLKASVDVNAYPVQVRPILVAMKRYGMILADNGSPFYFSGAPDPRWHDTDLDQLKKLKGRDFEVVQIGTISPP